MKQWKFRILATSALFVLVAFLVVVTMRTVRATPGTITTAAAQTTSESVAAVEITRDQVSWQPLVDYDIAGAILVVSGPEGFLWQGEFDPGTAPSFQAVDDNGAPLTNGSYQYELRILPQIGPEAQAALAAARETRDPAVVAELQAAGLLPEGPFVQTGAFTVFDGVFLTGGSETAGSPDSSAPSPQDQVIADDLIVQRSACIGFDCVNGEVFNADTLRFKENNLRIHFDDTSVDAGFPANDWRIVINDAGSGGANFFGIQDATASRYPFMVEAGAPNNALYLDATGRIGVGTSTPLRDLHVVAGNTPAWRLAQDGSDGFAAQTWDVAGNEANFFVRDVTNGSLLPFRIQPGAASSSLYIGTNGIGLGTSSPGAQLHLVDEAPTVQIERDDGVTSTVVLDLDSNGNLTLGGLLTEASDRNLKENFVSVDGAEILAGIAQLPIMTWNFINQGADVQHIGPVAQDFHAIFGFGEDDRHIAPLDANGVTLAGVQALYELALEQETQMAAMEQQLQDQSAEIAELQQQNDDLEARLTALEKRSGAPAANSIPWGITLPVVGGLVISLALFKEKYPFLKGGARE